MPTVVGVELRYSTKALSFDPQDQDMSTGDIVIVETERGSEIGVVLEGPHDVAKSDLVAPLKPVLRVADDDDIAHAEDLERQEAEAMPVFRELVKKHKLDMKPVAVEYLFDGGKVVFYFSAEERVDFRDLVRDLAARFKARIDMRQIGVRDEARMVGGIGHCGQVLCCVRFPGDFHPVSIRMAKEQDLPLNPLKISGLCGRLMCCLRYEYDAYKDFKSRAPKRKAIIETPMGLGKVVELNTPKETVTMRLEDGQRMTVPLCAMECGKDGGRPCAVNRERLEQEAPAVIAAVTPVSAQAPASAPPKEKSQGGDGKPKRRRRSKGGGSSSKSGGGTAGSDGGSERGSGSGSRGSRTSGKQSGKGSSSGKGSQSGGSQKDGQPRPSRRRRRRRRPSQGGSKEGSGTD